MKLSNLRQLLSIFGNKVQRGKRLKANKIRKVMDKLEKKQQQFTQAYRSTNSKKEKSRLSSKKKIVAAQIKKAQVLLKKLDP